jgi:hexulose-6-phosphate isomerase
MKAAYGRRDFMRVTGSFLTGATLVATTSACTADSNERRIKKALKFSMVEEGSSVLERFRLLKKLGFDGVELDSPNSFDDQEVLQARDETGLLIPGVIDSVHWSEPLSDPDPAVRQAGLEGLKTALRDARTYGADTALLVPAVVDKNTSYDEAYVRSQAEIRKVLPLAEEVGVKIAVENVWNNFLLSPLEMARYLDEFESPWIGAYFDVGNVVNYGWPEQWIRILGHRVLKLDIKEFSRQKRDEEGLWAGFEVKIGEGDCDWPAVMEALVEIGYEGWGSAEVTGGGAERLEEISERMDRVLVTA